MLIIICLVKIAIISLSSLVFVENTFTTGSSVETHDLLM